MRGYSEAELPQSASVAGEGYANVYGGMALTDKGAKIGKRIPKT